MQERPITRSLFRSGLFRKKGKRFGDSAALSGFAGITGSFFLFPGIPAVPAFLPP